MQQLTKIILKFLTHGLLSLQTGEDNQETPNNRLIEPGSSLIESYFGNEDFYLEKLVEDSKGDSEFPSRIYQSYKKFKSNKKGIDISLKIIKSFYKSDNIKKISSTEVYKYLLKIVISSRFDKIKFGKNSHHLEYFSCDLRIFKKCLEKGRIILKREFFEGEETKKLNFEKFLIFIGFFHGCEHETSLEDYLFDILKADKIYKILNGIDNNNIKENLEERFSLLLRRYGEKRFFETYFSIVKFVLESDESKIYLTNFEFKFYDRIIKHLNEAKENLLEGLTVKKEFEEITQKILDKAQIFNKKEEETNFSTEMFCILYYLDIYNTLYKHDGEVYNDKENFLMKRIRKSKEYINKFPSENLYKEAENLGKDIDMIKDIFFIYRYRDIPYIKEMNLEKFLEMKTCFFLKFISSHYSSVTNWNTKNCEGGFCFILAKETNPKFFRRKLEMGLIRINFENRFEIFYQFTRTFIGLFDVLFNEYAYQFLSQFDDVFIETYKKCLNSTDYLDSSPVESFFSTACSFNVESRRSMRFLMLYLSEYKRILGEDCFLECSDNCLDKVLKKLENCLQKIEENEILINCSSKWSYNSMLTSFLKELITSNKRKTNQEKIFKRILNIKKRGFESDEKIKSQSNISPALICLYGLDLSCFVDINKYFARNLIIKILEAESVEQILEILRFCSEFLFTVFSKEKELNKRNSFIHKFYQRKRKINENLRRKTHYEIREIGTSSQKTIFNFYQTAYKIFNQLEKPTLDKSRNECLNLFKGLFPSFDVTLLIESLNTESIVDHSCLKGIIPAFELVKAIACYNGKFRSDFNLMREEFIKIEAFEIYQKINNDVNQDIIPEKDFLVFLDIFFYYSTYLDSQNNELFNFYQVLLEKYAEENKSHAYVFIKTFNNKENTKELMERQTKKEVRLFNLVIKYSLKELEEFNVKGVNLPEDCVFYQVFINFLTSTDFRYYFTDKMNGLELMKKILDFYTDDSNTDKFSPYFRDQFFNVFDRPGSNEIFILKNKNMEELYGYYCVELLYNRK